jgi:hypothetical protein
LWSHSNIWHAGQRNFSRDKGGSDEEEIEKGTEMYDFSGIMMAESLKKYRRVVHFLTLTISGRSRCAFTEYGNNEA